MHITRAVLKGICIMQVCSTCNSMHFYKYVKSCLDANNSSSLISLFALATFVHNILKTSAPFVVSKPKYTFVADNAELQLVRPNRSAEEMGLCVVLHLTLLNIYHGYML